MDPEDGSNKLLRNISNHSLADTSYVIRLYQHQLSCWRGLNIIRCHSRSTVGQ